MVKKKWSGIVTRKEKYLNLMGFLAAAAATAGVEWQKGKHKRGRRQDGGKKGS